MYREFKRVLKALKEFEPEVARRRVSRLSSRTSSILNESKRPQVVRHTRLDHGRAIVPILFRKLSFLLHKVTVRSREFLQHSRLAALDSKTLQSTWN